MAKPFVLFPDPIAESLRVLRDGFLADPDVSPTGATVSRSMPSRTADTAAPAVLVALDGDAGSDYWPAGADALMRVSVWDADPFRALRLANLAQAHLLAYPGDAKVRDYRFNGIPFPTTDPDDGSPVASFIIIARLRAE